MVTLTLEIQETVLEKARNIAQHTQRPVEEVLGDWLANHAKNLPLDELPDNLLMQEVHIMMDDNLQEEMSLLLGKNRENEITEPERERLDELVEMSQRLTLHKAKAIRAAVERGLIPPINEWTDPIKPPMGLDG